MENLFDELGIPKNHIRKSSKNDRFVVLVHKQWLKSLCKHSTLTEFIRKPNLETSPLEEESSLWSKIFVSVYKKRDAKVIPLPRIRQLLKEDNPLMYHQLLQYICQTNYKNLWKDAYRKYAASEFNKETQVPLVYYNEVLREILLRIYECPIINNLDTQEIQDDLKSFNTHPNILPAMCGIETLNAFFLFHLPYFDHTLSDCVTFSPAILDKCWTKPLFIVYQLLQLLKSFHDRSLTLGDISLNDIYLTENLWIHVFPQVSSNICLQDLMKSGKPITKDCKLGHKFDNNSRCENCGLKTFDRVPVLNRSLHELSDLWIEGKISNFTYISVLNKFSGRKLGDPNCHYVFPWVTDFASSNGKNWRDLKKSKFRLNKGDRQLDLTYDHSQAQVPHHVSDVLSPITYYVYMARRTPKSMLCKNVRTIWVPAEYPNSIQRMYDWTPDECIPEFFTDPSVFRSIHDDLDDLEVPMWASGPEDFVEKHRQALESDHVSEKLHYWIDLTFGYKLSGTAAVKAKNVCLHLADDHTNLTKSGLVQLFVHPHPPKAVSSPFFGKLPPKIIINKSRSRDRGNEDGVESGKSDEDEIGNTISETSVFGLSRIMSRSRSSLSEDQGGSKISRSPSAQRSASLGPKTASFTSHINHKGNLMGVIELPKEYRPEFALENLEKRFSFMSKTFYTECAKSFEVFDDEIKNEDHSLVQNSFTNFIYAEGFKEKLFSTPNPTKSHTFPLDNCKSQIHLRSNIQQKTNQIMCNYSEIICTRKVRELQVLGCLIVEIFMAKHLRALGSNNIGLTFSERFKNCLTVIENFRNDIPRCISYIVNLLLQPSTLDLKKSRYAPITDLGLPPPSAHLLLEPLLCCLIPFHKSFPKLYMLIESLKEFKNVELELDLLYHFDCDGTTCLNYEQLEKTKILFAQNIAECKIKLCVKHLEELLSQISPNYDVEIVNIIVCYIIDLIEEPPTSVLSAWYLFDPIARVLGPRRTSEMLLQPILKLFENEPNETSLPFYGKIAKLYHHSFLLRLIVRLGLKCFLDNFMTPLVEAVGGYKDYEKVEFSLHTHLEKIPKKTSHLKTMQADKELSGQTEPKSKIDPPQFEKDEELFELDEEKENEEQMRSLIEHLELNIASDLPFNHSTAEEALDAITFSENIEQIQNLEEMTINLDEAETGNKSGITSPTIPIPSSYHNTLTNISCEIGSKISESGSVLVTKSFPLDSPSSLNDHTKNSPSSDGFPSKPIARSRDVDIKISEISVDSIIWLSHRLGPVLMARFLSRNLLKMLTLCYVGRDNLASLLNDDDKADSISISFHKVVGDQSAIKVLDCLTSIAALYGEKLILFQYLPHVSELLTLCKKKITPTLEGGLISCLVLLKHIIPYLSDSTLMDQLQDILANIIHPTVRLLGSTKHAFPNGSVARNVLARKYIDTLYILSVRIGSDMSRKYLSVPSLQRFFLLFNKVCGEQVTNHPSCQRESLNSAKSPAELEASASISMPHIRLKDSDSLDSLSPTHSSYLFDDENVVKAAMEEIRNVFTPELAHSSYLPFLNHMGIHSLDISLKNHDRIRELCQVHEHEMGSCESSSKLKIYDFKSCQRVDFSGSIGSNVSVIGNRIDVQDQPCLSPITDLLTMVSNKIENSSRHLRGNWFSYWAHEIGRHEKDNSFNFNQIKLQTFVGHINSIKCIHTLDNENSFMSGSRDKTIKLWSLRSQGDGSATSNCQWTYTSHKKSILSMTFIESMRLVASCDSVVHLWDPFMGVSIAQLESSKYCPVNVVRSMPAPSSLVFSATTEGTIKIIDTRLTTYVYDLKITLNPSGLIRCLAISPSGSWIAAGQSSGCITVLDTRTGLVVSSWRAHEGEVLQLAAVDDNALISSSLDQTITVWNVSDGKFKHHMRGPTEPAHCLVVYDQCQLISATTANRVGVHTSIGADSSYSSTKLRSDTFKGLLTSVAILPLNRLLLLGADNGQISLLC